jgi:signal transduction histidine kinase
MLKINTKEYGIKQLSLRIKIFYLFIIYLLVALSINSFVFYKLQKENLYHEIDAKLNNVALSGAIIFGDKFHNDFLDNPFVNERQNKNNALLLSQLTDESDVKFVYTMVKKGKDVCFTCSSVTLEQQAKDEGYLDFLLPYKSASKKLKNAFEDGKKYYGEITDEYGSFRSVLIPRILKDGSYYIVGADIDISFIKKNLQSYTIKLLMVEFLFLCFFMFFIYLYFKAHQKEERLNQKKDEILREQSKLSSMGEMLRNIAHQWRQPLSEINAVAMKIDADFYKKRLNASKLESNIQRLENITEHMSNTIESFNSYFKEKKQSDATTLQTVVEKSLNIMDTSLKDIKVDVEIKDDSTIELNISDFIQVLHIILNNAVDALISEDIQNKTITITVKKVDDKHTIEIEDNGGGIKEENIDKIFEPYYSTKFKANGIGIGLYIAKVIIEENLKGTLRVSNTLKGARFTITL